MRKKSINKKSNPVALFIVEGYTEENYVKILKQLYLQNVITENCLGGPSRKLKTKNNGSIPNNRFKSNDCP